jgi:hypothetical protein
MPETKKIIADGGPGTSPGAEGAVPPGGDPFSAAAGAWSEKDREKVNRFIEHWKRMMTDELAEKKQTFIDIMTRLDFQDEKVLKRLDSEAYQSLVRKTFRDWAGTESRGKRDIIRNVLANAATTDTTSDDVVRLFLDWIRGYSELHFKVINAVHNSNGITRAGIWKQIGQGFVREESADGDLYKLLIRDLITGGIIRQHRDTDYYGNPVSESEQTHKRSGAETARAAFDDEDYFELTPLGKQFVHYAMTEIPPKIEIRKP